jgi:hypothetical protein
LCTLCDNINSIWILYSLELKEFVTGTFDAVDELPPGAFGSVVERGNRRNLVVEFSKSHHRT